MLKGFTDWLDGTQLSLLFKTTHWLIPASQSVHIVAVAVVLSAFLMLTLRGHGVSAPGVGISLLNARFLPWVWIAIAVLLVTGVLQIIAEPGRALPNPFFQAKMAFLIIVMAMVGWFQRSVSRDPDRWDGRHLFPGPVRAMFSVVLLLTLAIIFCGRWIAYATFNEGSAVYEMLQTWAEWLENTRLALAIAEGAYPFPILETLHVIGVTTVVGTIAIVDLRLLDLASRSRPVRELVHETLPYTWGGFVLALLTGALMFISKATVYLANIPFRIKLCVLALAGLNMLAFHLATFRSVDTWDHGIRTPSGARVAGATSLAFWITVIFLGRWIAFVE